MKVRPSHIVVAVLVVVGAVVVYAIVQSRKPVVVAPEGVAGKTDEFLAQVETLRAAGRGSDVTAGVVPSADVDLSKRPKIELATGDEINVGIIPNTGVFTTRTPVKNAGGMPLEITEVRAACGCTQGKFERVAVRSDGKQVATIPPGQTADLIITVDPKLVPGFQAYKSVTLFSNDPITPQYVLLVKADIDPEYLMEPHQFDFGTVPRGTSKSITMSIRQAGEQPVAITGVEVVSEGGRRPKGAEATHVVMMDLVRLPQDEWRTPGRPEWIITATLDPSAPAGEVYGVAAILSDVPRIPHVDVKITGYVESFYTVEPQNLASRAAVKPGQRDVAVAKVTAQSPIQVSNVRVTGDDLSVTLVPGAQPTEAELHLHINETADPGIKKEEVAFTITSGDRTLEHTMNAFVSVTAQTPPAQ